MLTRLMIFAQELTPVIPSDPGTPGTDATPGGIAISSAAANIVPWIVKAAIGDLKKESKDRKLSGWKSVLLSAFSAVASSTIEMKMAGLPWKVAATNSAIGFATATLGYLSKKHGT